jgi:DoxX-like family
MIDHKTDSTIHFLSGRGRACSQARPRTKEVVVFAALSVLMLVGCLLPGAAKVAGHPRMRESARHFRIGWQGYRLIGVAELAAAAGILAGLWWHPLGLAAAAGMAFLMMGALITHRRAGDRGKDIAPALITLLIAAGYLITALV